MTNKYFRIVWKWNCDGKENMTDWSRMDDTTVDFISVFVERNFEHVYYYLEYTEF